MFFATWFSAPCNYRCHLRVQHDGLTSPRKLVPLLTLARWSPVTMEWTPPRDEKRTAVFRPSAVLLVLYLSEVATFLLRCFSGRVGFDDNEDMVGFVAMCAQAVVSWACLLALSFEAYRRWCAASSDARTGVTVWPTFPEVRRATCHVAHTGPAYQAAVHAHTVLPVFANATLHRLCTGPSACRLWVSSGRTWLRWPSTRHVLPSRGW